MNTNIALVGADSLATSIQSRNNVVVDPSSLMEQARKGYNKDDDIEEDENDRFIASRKGKLRPRFQTGPDAEDWAEDSGSPSGRFLLRPKRGFKDAEREEEDHHHHRRSKDEKTGKRDKKSGRKEKELKENKKPRKDNRGRYRSKNEHRVSSKAEHLSVSPSKGSEKIQKLRSHPKRSQIIYLVDSSRSSDRDLNSESSLFRVNKEKTDMKPLKEGQKDGISIEKPADLNQDSKLQETKSNKSLSDSTVVSAEKSARKVNILSRQKRCGGGGGYDYYDYDYDDDDDANRSRRSRSRRTRRNRRRNSRRGARRARKKAEKAAQSTVTTVTRSILQGAQALSQGAQVVSQAVGNQPVSAEQQQQVAQQPMILQQAAPATVIQSTPPQTIIQQPAQPVAQTIAPVQPVIQNAAPVQPVAQQPTPLNPQISQTTAGDVAAQGSLQGSVQTGATIEGAMKISA